MSEKTTAPTLVLLVDGVVSQSYPLDRPRLTVGRGAGNDIRIEDVAVSGKHAHLLVTPNRYLEGAWDVILEDLGSTNGTRVNGAPTTRCRLRHNDTIQIGWNMFKLLDERQVDHERTAYIVRA